MLSALIRSLSEPPAFRIFGKAKPEREWRVIDVFAVPRRNLVGGRKFFSGTCITWTSEVIAIGCDFAEGVLEEQIESPASREHPVEVLSGRLHHGRDPSAVRLQSFSEVMAHECGHTYQARRLGPLYLLTGALFTWWREGPHWWNRFENRASELGQFGGIVDGSVRADLWERVS